jgi:hypothetical protein
VTNASRTIPCPYEECRAAIGAPCRDSQGNIVLAHKARVDAAPTETARRAAELRDLRRVYRAAKKLMAEPDSATRMYELEAMVALADETVRLPSAGSEKP